MNSGVPPRSSTRSYWSVKFSGEREKSIAPATVQACSQARCEVHRAVSTW
ncbi:Uncharacterised protein [Bordetella pertussis]|nr:Uncharacterised protein [Bordetella pertussis]CFW45596.1 Uncharacterised protein [Bordetella pertussis]